MHGYPRPQLRRATWTSLNGEWDFAIDHDARWEQPSQVQWERTIRVPYAPETAASGIQEMGLVSACWYRRDIDEAALSDGERLILHFGAVDYEACVWFNDCLVATHEGGYTPFAVDVTPLLRPGSQCPMPWEHQSSVHAFKAHGTRPRATLPQYLVGHESCSARPRLIPRRR